MTDEHDINGTDALASEVADQTAGETAAETVFAGEDVDQTEPEPAAEAVPAGELVDQAVRESSDEAIPTGDLDAILAAAPAIPDTRPVPVAEPEAEAGRASAELKAIIEALVFASPDPITLKALLKLLDSEPREDVEASLTALQQDYDDGGGLHLVEVAGGYQITTRPELHEWVRRLFHERKTQKLSVQALETLAVIAYKQPITAPEITEIRGVNTAGVLATLLERRLIKIAGRKQVVGRPFLYATTREFLIRFGLRDMGDLPKIEDMADVLGFEPPEGLLESETTAMLPLEGDNGGGGGTDGSGPSK
jgi:segregation and condensation protein B